MNMVTHIAPETAAEARRRRRWPWLAAGSILLIGVAAYEIGHKGAPAAAATTLPNVAVSTPLQRSVTEWDDYVGRFAPSQTVEVRPRVSGAITAIHFKDGEIVRKGQLLFTIDVRPFAAAMAEARAGVASARSQLVLANADLARANRLTGDEAISAGELDTLRAKAQAADAALAAAQARLRQRALDLEFTQVRAPIGGRISDRRADVGNLVAAEGASTLLTTINALDPIYFSFDGSEALYLKALRSRQSGAPATVQIKLQDEQDYRWKGRIDFSDNGIDQRSGTMRSRAVIANPDYFLTPGMFGNMRLASAGKVQALLVPDTAVQTDQARKTLLVVAADGTVSAKPVELGPVVNGLRIIRAGIAPNDRVIIQGTQSAMPGGKVAPHAGRITEDAPAVANAVAPPSAEATLGN